MVDCVVLKALEFLTDKLSRGSNHVILTNKEDIDRTKDLLKRLYDDGQNIDPDSIYEWTIKNEWPERYAKRLREYAQDISSGVNPRIQFKFAPDILKSFYDECEE